MLTDSSGNFQFSQLTPGGSYTVRPSDNRFNVSPTTIAFPNIVANQSGATFTATLIIGTVFGRVLGQGAPLSGVLVGLGQLGVITQTMTTGADGRWSFTGTLIGQAYEVDFVRSGYSIFPPSLIFPVNIPNQEMGDVTATKGNDIDASDFFVTKHYDDFLGRIPDASGLSFWINNIEACTFFVQCRAVKRIDTSAAFFLSIEFQETGFLVYRANQAAYGDAFDATIPTPGSPLGYPVPNIRRAEFIADTPLISQGVQVGVGNWEQQLETNKQAFMLAFVERSRFTTAFPTSMTADEFVTKLDQNAGGVLSAFEKSLLLSVLGTTPADATKRSQVLRSVAEDADLKNRETMRAFVLMQYFGYLRRNPNDPPEVGLNYAGYKFWLDKLNSFNGDFRGAEMVKAFITSGEYRGRFGRRTVGQRPEARSQKSEVRGQRSGDRSNTFSMCHFSFVIDSGDEGKLGASSKMKSEKFEMTNGKWFVLLLILVSLGLPPITKAQDTVTGAFEGVVSDSQTGAALKGALVEIINQQTGVTISLVSDYRGRFYQGLLLPGVYRIRVSTAGYEPREVLQRLKITYTGEVVPVPVALDPVSPTPAPVGVPVPSPTPISVDDTEIRSTINSHDARRSGSFSSDELLRLAARESLLTQFRRTSFAVTRRGAATTNAGQRWRTRRRRRRRFGGPVCRQRTAIARQ